jgi:hypothetical protein
MIKWRTRNTCSYWQRIIHKTLWADASQLEYRISRPQRHEVKIFTENISYLKVSSVTGDWETRQTAPSKATWTSVHYVFVLELKQPIGWGYTILIRNCESVLNNKFCFLKYIWHYKTAYHLGTNKTLVLKRRKKNVSSREKKNSLSLDDLPSFLVIKNCRLAELKFLI